MNNVKRNMVTGVAACLASLVAFAQPSSTYANELRVHAGNCHTQQSSTNIINGTYLYDNQPSTYTDVYCYPPSTNFLPHGTATLLNVHGYSPGGNSEYVEACVHSYGSTANTCGTQKNWDLGYSGATGIDLTAWHNDAYGFPYIHVSMSQGGYVYGYYISN